MIRHLSTLDCSKHCVYESSVHQDKMEVTSCDNFHLAPPGWSDSPLSESDDCDTLRIELLEAFLNRGMPWTMIKSVYYGLVARCFKLSQRCYRWI